MFFQYWFSSNYSLVGNHHLLKHVIAELLLDEMRIRPEPDEASFPLISLLPVPKIAPLKLTAIMAEILKLWFKVCTMLHFP